MVTYYSDADVTVTSTTFRVDGRDYPLAELTRVWHQRGRRSWSALAGRGALGVALVIPVVTAALGVLVAIRADASSAVTVAVVGVSLLIGFAVMPIADIVLEWMDRSYARGSRRMEIWAEWRGRPVLLLTTRDALRFGKIYRALQRAVERTGTARVRPRER